MRFRQTTYDRRSLLVPSLKRLIEDDGTVGVLARTRLASLRYLVCRRRLVLHALYWDGFSVLAADHKRQDVWRECQASNLSTQVIIRDKGEAIR